MKKKEFCCVSFVEIKGGKHNEKSPCRYSNVIKISYVYCNDEHPLPYLRVNCSLQQFDQFLDLYGIKEGDKMYLAPEDRVNIW